MFFMDKVIFHVSLFGYRAYIYTKNNFLIGRMASIKLFFVQVTDGVQVIRIIDITVSQTSCQRD